MAVFMVLSILVLIPESRASATRPVRATSRIPYGCSRLWMADIFVSLPWEARACSVSAALTIKAAATPTCA